MNESSKEPLAVEYARVTKEFHDYGCEYCDQDIKSTTLIRLKQLGTLWFTLNCKEAHCTECESQHQCFQILHEMANLRRKQRENNVHLHTTR